MLVLKGSLIKNVSHKNNLQLYRLTGCTGCSRKNSATLKWHNFET